MNNFQLYLDNILGVKYCMSKNAIIFVTKSQNRQALGTLPTNPLDIRWISGYVD